MKLAKILIVDDHQIMRDGLRLLLREHPEFEVVGDAFDTEAGWQAVTELKPDIVLLDLEMPGESGVALARRVREQEPEIKIIILTGHSEPQLVDQALRTGAHGFVLKNSAGGELIAALRAVLAGQAYLCPAISTHVLREYRLQAEADDRPGRHLSVRELDVLRLIAAGQTTKEIAFSLSVSAKTVETHRAHLLSKLQVNSVAELVKYAVREGLTTL